MDDVTDQQYTNQGQIPERFYATLPALKKQAKGLEYKPQIIKESPEQEERQKRINEILEEFIKINSSKKEIGKQIESINRDIYSAYNKLTNEQIIEKDEEKQGLYTKIKELNNNMIPLADEIVSLREEEKKEAEAAAAAAAEAEAARAGEEAVAGGGKRKSKGKSKKVAKKPVVSQKKQSIYKEILGKQMKIYKMPDSRKEYVKYKGELLRISDYKDLMKQKAIAKTKTKATKVTKVTQQKAKSKTKK